jgi:hypothetical protein
LASVLLLWTNSPLLAWTCLAVLIGCHLAAGVVWGLQRTFDLGAKAGLTVLQSRLPELIDLLLGPLVRVGQDRVPQVALSEVRDYWRQATEQLLAPPEQNRWWRWLHRLTGFVVRWCLRAELAIVEQVIATFERRGETRISLDSLKNVVRDETIARGRLLAYGNLWQLEIATAACVLILLLLPAAILFGVA